MIWYWVFGAITFACGFVFAIAMFRCCRSYRAFMKELEEMENARQREKNANGGQW